MQVCDETALEQEIRAVLAKHRCGLRGHRVLLFGSRARGESHRRSDFDLGVDGDDSLGLSTFFEVQADLEQIPTLYRIDWVDLNRAPGKLREQARLQGRTIYEG